MRTQFNFGDMVVLGFAASAARARTEKTEALLEEQNRLLRLDLGARQQNSPEPPATSRAVSAQNAVATDRNPSLQQELTSEFRLSLKEMSQQEQALAILEQSLVRLRVQMRGASTASERAGYRLQIEELTSVIQQRRQIQEPVNSQ